MWQLTADGGWWTMVNQVSHPTALPLSFFHMRSRCHVGRQWKNDVGQQWHATTTTQQQHDILTTDHNDDAGNSVTSRLLLPCQLTCALHSWGIDVVHDPWMYLSWVFNLWNPMYTLTCTCRLPWPMSRVWVSGGYGYRSSWSDLGVTCADH